MSVSFEAKCNQNYQLFEIINENLLNCCVNLFFIYVKMMFQPWKHGNIFTWIGPTISTSLTYTYITQCLMNPFTCIFEAWSPLPSSGSRLKFVKIFVPDIYCSGLNGLLIFVFCDIFCFVFVGNQSAQILTGRQKNGICQTPSPPPFMLR